MRTFLTIIFLAVVGFDFFMATPFGAFWMMDNLDNGKPCYGIIIAFIITPIAMIIGCYLGIVK